MCCFLWALLASGTGRRHTSQCCAIPVNILHGHNVLWLSYGRPMVSCWPMLLCSWPGHSIFFALCGIIVVFAQFVVLFRVSLRLLASWTGKVPFSLWLVDGSGVVKLWSAGSVSLMSQRGTDKGEFIYIKALRQLSLFPAYRILAPTPLMCRSRMPLKR